MPSPFRRTVGFVRKHRAPIALSVGVVAGAAITHKFHTKSLLVFADPEQLQKLINEPGGGMQWSRPFSPDIVLASTANPTLNP